MKSKSFFVLFLLATFFSVIITPVFAATPQQQSPVFAAEQMPTWLAEAGAVPVADAQLELVQGEEVALLSTLCYLAVVYGVPFAINYAAYVGTQAHLTQIALNSLLMDWVKSHWVRGR